MAVPLTPNQVILGLDVGDARIGLAVAGSVARLPSPIETIQRGDDEVDLLQKIISRESADIIVVGIPRNLSGEETAQSTKIRQFADFIKQNISVPIIFVDESLSSKRADEYIKNTKNAEQDSVAACFILQEYFDTLEVA